MMDTAHLIDFSKGIFSDLKPVGENIFRGKLPVEGKIAGIYYLNFNKEIAEKDFEELQYKYLANEFYSQEASLQWNIYLLYINSNVDDALKVKILTDDKYARKLIFTGSEFIKYFELEKSQHSALPDIVSDWKKELNSVGLHELYSEVPIESVIRNFRDNTVSEIVKRPVKSLENIPIIKRIKSISLKDNYRPFPLERDFNFGLVNLFTGSNGVGKTSLMESIELVLTGRTQRNKDKNENVNSITAVYNEGVDDSYNHNNGYYKQRGVKWYERRASEQLNKTYESFNRFNFFNTDAASIFASSDHKDQINESLKQIILGEEYTLLKDRIVKIEVRLRAELARKISELKKSTNILADNKQRISELKSDKNFEGLKQDIKKNINNLGYKANIDESQYSISELSINEIRNEVDFIRSTEWVTDFKKFREIKEDGERRIEKVSENKEKIELNNKELVKLQSDNSRLLSLESKFIALLRYFDIDPTSKIEDLDTNLSRIKVQLSIINTLKDLKNFELNVLQLKEETKALPLLINEKAAVIEARKKLLRESESELKIIQDAFSTAQKLSNQIKHLGKEILTHNTHSENCPLCEQQISRSELLAVLESEFNENLGKGLLNEKSSKVSNLRSEIVVLEKELSNLKAYYSTASNYLVNYENLSFNQIDKEITNILEKEMDVLTEKNKLENLILKLADIGGSVSEYLSIKEEIAKEYGTEVIFEKDSLSEFLINLKNTIATNSDAIASHKEYNNKIISDLNLLLKLGEYVPNLEKIEGIVKSDEIKIDSIKFSFENLRRYLTIPDDKLIIDLAKEVNLLNQNLETFRHIESSQNEIKRLLLENDIIVAEIPKLKESCSRFDKAVKSLAKLSSNSEDAQLEKYFSQNLEEIKDIFTTIHSPTEFSDIKYQKHTIVLFKKDKEYLISEISTGQRAALVLSIFISLNRKLKNGPNILIFDDPVTFIDDFNALSFLDFLRYFIVKEKKQIFFATANKKFSTLFKKKFDFLGEGNYKEFVLER